MKTLLACCFWMKLVCKCLCKELEQKPHTILTTQVSKVRLAALWDCFCIAGYSEGKLISWPEKKLESLFVQRYFSKLDAL